MLAIFSLIQLICSAVILGIYLQMRHQRKISGVIPLDHYLSDILATEESIERLLVEIRDQEK